MNSRQLRALKLDYIDSRTQFWHKLVLYHLHPKETVDLSPADWRSILCVFDAYWRRQDTPDAPYVELTSGNISDGYVNWWEVIKHSTMAEMAARALLEQLPDDILYPSWGSSYDAYYERSEDCWVLGVPDGATQFAAILALQLSKIIKKCCWNSAPLAKIPNSKNPKKSLMEWKRDTLSSAARVILVEDVITTGESTQQAIKAIINDNKKRNADDSPSIVAICCLTNRSGLDTIPNPFKSHPEFLPIVSLTKEKMNIWTPEEFKAKYPDAIIIGKAKTGDNWRKLMEHCAPLE